MDGDSIKIQNFTDWKDNLLNNPIKKDMEIIEQTLASYGLTTRVAEVNIEKDYIEYCLSVVVGLNLDELEKHDRDLALALASPTGKVKMIIPIPGRSLVGIQVPKIPKEELLLREKQNKEKKINNTWRNAVANIFMLIGYIFFVLGKKIIKEQ